MLECVYLKKKTMHHVNDCFTCKYCEPLPKNISSFFIYYMQLVFSNKCLLNKILDKPGECPNTEDAPEE